MKMALTVRKFGVQLLCLFTALLLAGAVRAADAPSAFKHITIDGSFTDWAGIAPAFEDAADSADSADYKAIYLAHDDDYLYIRFTQHTPHSQFTSHENIFIDTDNNPATGLSLFLGSEMLIQGGAAYDERGGGFNEGDVSALGWSAAPSGAATDFEVRISRHATYASDSAPVFASDSIAILLESEDANFNRKDTAPDAEGLTYTFTPAPPALTGSANLITMGSTSWRHFTPDTAAAAPDASWKTAAFDDSSWATGVGAFGYPPNATIGIQTDIPSGRPVFYLRTKFNWDKDTAGIVLPASVKLSDGAVIYVNGEEVRRLHMPAGPIDYNTPANGAPPTQNPEIVGVPANALIVGENLVAVEVHDRVQGAADLYFDLGLQASSSYPVIITDANQPADRSVVAGQSTTFTVEVLGTDPLTYQWLKNNEPIQGANGPTYQIQQVLAGDAGAYSVHVTNTAGGSVTSRAAQLTVTGTPVAITNANLPADQTVAEGTSVTFTVEATGSAPVSYQWYKGQQLIQDATSASYTISNVTSQDAGNYFVRVSNPVNSVDSRTAVLTVRTDSTPPTITSVTGSPDTVLVEFSEPIDPSTAVAGSFGLSGGLQIGTVTPVSGNPAQVAITTSAQTLGTQYTLTATGIKDRFGNTIAAGASQTFRSTISIDGSFDDWASLPIAFTDEQESPPAGTDFKDIWVFSDADYIYIRFTLYAPGNPNTFLNNIFIDADNSNTTGFGTYGIGSDMLIQEGAGYQEKNGGFNEGGIDGLDFSVAPEGTGSDFELRFSRHATYASDSQPVFTSDTIRFFLETENSSFQAQDTAPNSGGLEATLFLSDAGTISITRDNSSLVISWSGPARLQYRSSLDSGDWVDLTGETSPYTVAETGATGFYRLVQ